MLFIPMLPVKAEFAKNAGNAISRTPQDMDGTLTLILAKSKTV